MRKPKKVPAVKREPRTVHDVDVCAPEYFSVYPGRAKEDGAEFVRRLDAFVSTMFSLDRTVMVTRDENGQLYLSSIANVPDVG